MSVRTPILSPPGSQAPPRIDLPPPPRRRRRWIVVVVACVGVLGMIGSFVIFNATALRHDLLPMETFDDGTGGFDVMADDGSGNWAAYRDGAYVVRSNGDIAGGTASLTRTAGALLFAVDATVVSGTGKIVLTCAGDQEGYAFVIGATGRAAVYRARTDGTGSVLARAQVPAFAEGDTHHLLVSCVPSVGLGDGYVDGMIDGEVVISGDDPGPGFPIYAAGLMAAGSPLEVRFDNAEGGLDAVG